MDAGQACSVPSSKRRKQDSSGNIDYKDKFGSKKNVINIPAELMDDTIHTFEPAELMEIITYCSVEGLSILHYIAETNNHKLFNYLTKTNKKLFSNVNSVDSDGDTPLLSALRHKNYLLAIKLLDIGCDINIANKEGLTPLMCVVCDYDEFLYDHDTDINMLKKINFEALISKIMLNKIVMC